MEEKRENVHRSTSTQGNGATNNELWYTIPYHLQHRDNIMTLFMVRSLEKQEKYKKKRNTKKGKRNKINKKNVRSGRSCGVPGEKDC